MAVIGYYGLPFVMSLYLQQLRGLSPLGTGAAFLPMMLIGAALTPFSTRIAEQLGPRALITAGLASMAAGLVILAVLPSTTPVQALAGLMVLVGLAGPLVMPPLIAVLLNSVPPYRAGVASGDGRRQAGLPRRVARAVAYGAGGRHGPRPCRRAGPDLKPGRPRRLERLEENIGAALLEVGPGDLAEIGTAASAIQVQGARYPEHLERMTNL